jgi:adenylyltransferase/sulfurtransferase
MMEFTEQQLKRYSRNILVSQISVGGQKRISSGKIIVIGMGGLGSSAAFYCAAAGIGTLGIVDDDIVDISNLQRQIIHSTADIGIEKVESAKAKILALNPDVKVETFRQRVCPGNIRNIINGYDFVIDGTDNFKSKFLINDACVMEKIPFSHAGVLQFTGQTMTVLPGKSACYRCVFQAPPDENTIPSCSADGVLGAIAGIIGAIQATEALKHIAKAGQPLCDKILTFDALSMDIRTVEIQKRPNCPVCGQNSAISGL